MGFACHLAGRWLVLLAEGQEIGKRQLADADFARFKDCARRYGGTVRDDRGETSIALEPLLAIGREITAWFDEAGWMSHLVGTGPLAVDIIVCDVRSDDARALLDVPWEVMATAQGFLAADAMRPSCVLRRIDQATPGVAPPPSPRYQSLKLMFMAEALKTLMETGVTPRSEATFRMIYAGVSSWIAKRLWAGN